MSPTLPRDAKDLRAAAAQPFHGQHVIGHPSRVSPRARARLRTDVRHGPAGPGNRMATATAGRLYSHDYAGTVMRAILAYTSARIVLLVVSVVLLYLTGARGLLLLALAVSGIASYVLLSRQRDVMSGALMARLKNGRARATSFRTRLEDGARAEDED